MENDKINILCELCYKASIKNPIWLTSNILVSYLIFDKHTYMLTVILFILLFFVWKDLFLGIM